ncbi:MAG: hypothetical protein AAGL89_14150 [Pseudomonadota bacterium]
MTRTLALIFAALALMIGSFIWFVATWDRDAEEPIGAVAPPANLNIPFILSASKDWSIWQDRGFETDQFGNFAA